MAIVLAQIETAIDAAFAAFNAGETSYTVKGRMVNFASLPDLQKHIDWSDRNHN